MPWQSHRTKRVEQADSLTSYGGEAALSGQTSRLLRFLYRSSDAAEDGDSGRGVGGGFRSYDPRFIHRLRSSWARCAYEPFPGIVRSLGPLGRLRPSLDRQDV